MRRSIRTAIAKIAPTLGLVAGIAGVAAGQALEQQIISPSLGTTTQNFGRGVATKGDVMVAGSPSDDTNGANAGAAYVYRYNATTHSWTYEAQLMPSDPEVGANFGVMTAVDGDIAVVGAYLEDNAKGTDAGAVYVFRRNSSTGVWAQEQKLTPSVGAGNDQYGFTVSLVGTVLLVGAPYADTANGTDSGLVYVYRYKNSIVKWAEETTLVDPSGGASDWAGWSLAFDGATAVVGSPTEENPGFADSGTVGVWTVSGTTWTQTAELAATSIQNYSWFGSAVGVSGDQIVVGARYLDITGVTDAGGAYFFSKASGTWTQTGLITNPDPSISDQFGQSAAMSGKLAVVGSYLDNAFGRTDSGMAYTFRKGKGNKGWFLDQDLAASDGANYDGFAVAMACSDEHIVIGGYANDTTSGTDWGAVYAFDADEINLRITPTSPLPGETMTVSIYDGEENAPVLLVVDEVDGFPVFIEIVTFVFGADHRLTFDTDAENPLLGFNVGVTAWKISPTGPVVSSERVHVDV
ncbi:MAG: hypothetical protein JNL90_15390 [Planctomycetes bacterium]|nr:hypothetical protein [Planctomycetota bacterium]